MKVFRVEHESVIDSRTGLGCGPYVGSWGIRVSVGEGEARESLEKALRLLSEVTYSEDGASGRLNPIYDPSLRAIFPWEVCGFDSIENLRRWFGRALGALQRNGFEVRQYWVPDARARVGLDGQTLFEFKHAKRVQDSEELDV